MTKKAITPESSEGRALAARFTPRKRLSLDPDLTDGHHRCIHDVSDRVLMELITLWAESSEPGAEFTIKLIEMSDEEFSRLEDV